MDEWLEDAVKLHRKGEYFGAMSAALIGLLTWVLSEPLHRDDPDEEIVEEPLNRRADDLEHLVWSEE